MVKIPVAGRIELSKCKVHPNNVKEHPEKQIKNLMQLIEWVGFKDPIVLDKDNNVKAGHGRIIAAERLGMTEVPFVTLEGLTKKQMDLFIYMDNQINESPWIKENVELILKEIPKKDLELFDLNWDGVRAPDINEETEPIPEPPTEPKAKLGQIYQLGQHKLICGDATDPETFKKLLGEHKTTLAFTSPPYNVGNSEQKYENNTDNLKPGEYFEFLNKFTENCINFAKYTFVNIQYLASNKLTFIDYINHWKNHLVDRAIWNKKLGQPPRQRNVMNPAFEDILIFSTTAMAKKRQIETGDFHGTVQNIFEGRGNRQNEFADIHKATFPIDLPFHFIRTFSKINDTVIDPFGGTGTTLMACEQLYRTCYMIELDPGYVDVIIERWENYTKNKAVLYN